MWKKLIYNQSNKILFTGLFAISLVGCFIQPEPKMYIIALVLGILSTIILTERWHKQNPVLALVVYGAIAIQALWYILRLFGIVLY